VNQPSVILRDDDRDRLFEILLAVHNDPALFFQAVLNAELRTWQLGVCNKIKAKLENGETYIEVLARTAHGAGKGFLCGGLVLWLMATRPYSRALTLAPTWDGVENLLWPEIAALYRGSLLRPLGFGRMLTTKFDVEDKWYAIGASSDKPENLEGHHSSIAAMRIVDEAKAVEDATFDATDGMLDAPENFDIWISTPSIQAGKFFEKDTSRDESIIRAVVTVDDLIADGVTEKIGWKEKRLRDWGLDSPEYQSRALARYIDNAEGALFPVSWIERAMKQDWEARGNVVAGMDVAGSDDGDANAVALCRGPDPQTERYQVLSVDTWRERDTMISKGRALALARPFKARIAVDVIGLGKGVADALGQESYPRAEYRSTDKSRIPEDFTNRKAEDAWTLRKRLEDGTIRLPNSQALKAQLGAMKYEVMASGKKRVIDPKDSPDLADAVIIAVASSGRGPFQTAVADSTHGDFEREWKRSGM
jgi:phage terminase large subunit